jgi:hypothetical protein
VVEHLKPQDLPEALRWVKSKHQKPFSRSFVYFGGLAEGILQKTWEHFDAPGVLQDFSKICLERLRLHLPLLKVEEGSNDLGAALLQSEPLKRRRLVQELVPQLKADEAWMLINYAMISGDDLPWLIEQLEKDSRPGVDEGWLRLIERVFSQERADHLETVFVAKERNPRLARLLEVAIDSPEAEQTREAARALEGLRRQRELEQPPPVELRVRGALDDFEAGELAAWSRVGLELAGPPSSRRRYPTEDDLKSSLVALPGWKSLDELLRGDVLAAAGATSGRESLRRRNVGFFW